MSEHMIDICIMTCALVLVLSDIIYYISHKTMRRFRNWIFLTIMFNIALTAAADLTTNYIKIINNGDIGLYRIEFTSTMIFFILHTFLPAQLALYIALKNNVATQSEKKKFYVFSIPILMGELLILSNPFTKWIFEFENLKDYARGPLLPVSYGIGILYLIYALYVMIRYRRTVSKGMEPVVWLSVSIAVVGIIVQLIYPQIMIELFCDAIALTGILLTIENEDRYIDANTMAYNRTAFLHNVDKLMGVEKNFMVVSINITNIRILERILGSEILARAVAELVGKLRQLRKHDLTVYRNSANNIAVIYIYRDGKDFELLSNEIKELFEGELITGHFKIELNVVLSIAKVPQDIDNKDNLIDLIEENHELEENGVTVIKGKGLDYLKRRSMIEMELKEAVAFDNIEVYYQPIYNVATGMIDSCEALVRLVDSGIPDLKTDEFIKVAERNGMIGDIGMMVFDKTCEFLSKNKPEKYGLKYINVNLSLYQMIIDDVAVKFRETLDKHRLGTDRFVLEITETASLADNRSVDHSILRMKRAGFKFSLDDYGTGFSNLTNIRSMKFSSIKIDKSLLWNCNNKDNISSMILSNSVHMIRTMGMDVIQEGVETREQFELAKEIGVNYIQGFYISKPLPEKEFIEFLKGNLADVKG
ncbi:MAG: EAL domain-containing protein [Clostridiales bacterium]|nr:EAL domain-containing protein [Clostridiales bacterium]